MLRWAVLPLLLACALPPPLTVVDADGDGYRAGHGDCDDLDADVNPVAAETCNGVDDDCDGLVDVDACMAWAPMEELVSILGEDGVGTVMRTGRFDGDAVDDLLTAATIGNSPAMCVVGGVRVGSGSDQPLASVANCWITAPSQVLPVVVSADRYGVALPVGQDVAIVGTGSQVCVVDPFSDAYTLEEGAYGCVSTDELPAEVQGGFRLAPADVDRGTLAASSGVYLGIIDPIDYLTGAPPQPAVIEFPDRITTAENAGDLDGDGVTDIAVAVGSRAYLVRGDSDLTGPVELITPYFVDAAALITTAAGLGDVDGDGTAEWMTVGGAGTQVWSGTDAYSTIRDATVGAVGAGDFNGDGRSDLWAWYAETGPDLSGERLLLGGAWPLELWLASDADLAIAETVGGFGAQVTSAGDRAGDGYADSWISAPTFAVDEEIRGRLYRVDGFGVDTSRD